MNFFLRLATFKNLFDSKQDSRRIVIIMIEIKNVVTSSKSDSSREKTQFKAEM